MENPELSGKVTYVPEDYSAYMEAGEVQLKILHGIASHTVERVSFHSASDYIIASASAELAEGEKASTEFPERAFSKALSLLQAGRHFSLQK